VKPVRANKLQHHRVVNLLNKEVNINCFNFKAKNMQFYCLEDKTPIASSNFYFTFTVRTVLSNLIKLCVLNLSGEAGLKFVFTEEGMFS